MMNITVLEYYDSPTNGRPTNFMETTISLLGVPATKNETLGRWAHLHRKCPKERHLVLFSQMMANGKLHDRLTSIEWDARARAMNSIDARAREIVLEEIVHGYREILNELYPAFRKYDIPMPALHIKANKQQNLLLREFVK